MNSYRHIEQATARDIDAVAELYAGLNAYLERVYAEPWWRTGIYPVRDTALQALAEKSLFVWKEEGVVAGTVILNHTPEIAYDKTSAWRVQAPNEDILVVRTLATHPHYFRRGIARAMLEFAKDYARQKAQKSVRLDVFEKNEAAIRLYRSAGFQYIDTVDLDIDIPYLRQFCLFEYPL